MRSFPRRARPESRRRGSGDPPTERRDLSEEPDFLLELLRDPQAWRHRVVTQLRLGSQAHLRAISEYQIEFPPALLARYVDIDRTRSVNVLVPLTTKPKFTLLDLRLKSNGPAAVTRTPRPSVAGLEAYYLYSIMAASDAAAELEPLLDMRLLEAICTTFPPYFATNFLKPAGGEFVPALASYLQSGLGFEVGERSVERWREKTLAVADIVSRRLGEPQDPLSSSEEMLISIPEVSPLPRSIADIDGLVEGFHAMVQIADAHDEADLLMVLGEYGRRFEMLVEVEVPILEPTCLTIEEELPLFVEGSIRRPRVSYFFNFSEAASSSLEVRTEDPNIEFRDPQVLDQDGNDASGWVEGFRVTREAVSIYSRELGRPQFLRVLVELRVGRHISTGTIMLAAVNVAAIAFALAMVLTADTSSGLADRLALVAVPTTIGATFVLVREQSALATRLQVVPRLLLAGTALMLWATVSALLLLNREQEPATTSRTQSAIQHDFRRGSTDTQHSSPRRRTTLENGQKRS